MKAYEYFCKVMSVQDTQIKTSMKAKMSVKLASFFLFFFVAFTLRKNESNVSLIVLSFFAHSSHRGDEASSLLHDVLGQRERRSGEPQPGVPALLLLQGPAVLQAPAGQQHQRGGRHLLSRAENCKGGKRTALHAWLGVFRRELCLFPEILRTLGGFKWEENRLDITKREDSL